MTPNAISVEEEASLLTDVDRFFIRKRYEGGHFDKVITQYREVQKQARFFSEDNRQVLKRVRDTVFPPDAQLLPVHILDLAAEGEIGPHVDHVEYSGRFIVGLSLLTDAVMTLRHQHSDVLARILLPRRSLYVMVDESRYDWEHAIPLQEKGRRVSLLFRDRAEEDCG